MPQDLFVVDAFTSIPFAGNPAAVCLLDRPVDDNTWMQNVAREMKHSETAFIFRRKRGFDLRWFTPAVEVDLCGHATLASAHILFTEGLLGPDELAEFHTRSGLLTARFREGAIELNFPAIPLVESGIPAALVKAIGTDLVYVGKSSAGYLVLVDSEDTVRNLSPDFALMATLPVDGVIVTSRSSKPAYDFVSRFFAPRLGVDEDPVTGSAHCCLGPFWADRLGKRDLSAYQASERGGSMQVCIEGDRVILKGRAVTVLRGHLVEH